MRFFRDPFLEDPRHAPNQNRVAFHATSSANVDSLARFLGEIGAVKVEGRNQASELLRVFLKTHTATGGNLCSKRLPEAARRRRRPDAPGRISSFQRFRKVLREDLVRTRKLIVPIDKTIEHLKGTKKVKS